MFHGGQIGTKMVDLPSTGWGRFVTPGTWQGTAAAAVDLNGDHRPDPVIGWQGDRYTLTAVEGRYELAANNGLPPLRLHMTGEKIQLSLDGVRDPDILYRTEDDTEDRVLAHVPVRTDDVPPGFFLTMCRTGGVGKKTIINLKSLDVRAEGFIKANE